MNDFPEQYKKVLSHHNIDSYGSPIEAFMALQQFLRHWFGVIAILHNGEWRIMVEGGEEIKPTPEELTVASILQWCLDNRKDWNNADISTV